MNLNDRLKYCNTCSFRSYDPERGHLCGLTARTPAFEGTCPDYAKDDSANGPEPTIPADIAEVLDPSAPATYHEKKQRGFWLIMGSFAATVITSFMLDSVTVGLTPLAIGLWGTKLYLQGSKEEKEATEWLEQNPKHDKPELPDNG